MTQQVNLYLPELRVRKDPLSAVLMLQIVGGLTALLLLISAYDLVRGWQLERELEALQVTLEEETRRTEELDEVLAGRSENTGLTTRLERAEERLEASRQIRDFLSRTRLGNVEGFSEYFKDLSRASVDGLSITEFSFSNGGDVIQVAGQVLDSALVPRFVDNIQNGRSPLRNKRYSPLISRSERAFTFELSSTGETGE